MSIFNIIMFFDITHTENDTTRLYRRRKQFLNAEMFIWISTGTTGFVVIIVLVVMLAKRFFYCGNYIYKYDILIISY